MTSFLNQNTRTFHKIVFAHTKFGLVQMKGSEVRRGGVDSAPSLSEFLKSWSG